MNQKQMEERMQIEGQMNERIVEWIITDYHSTGCLDFLIIILM